MRIKHIETAYRQLKAAQKTLAQLENAINLSYQGEGIEMMRWRIEGVYSASQAQKDLDNYLSAIKALTQGFVPIHGCQSAGGGGTVES